jgi:hypothetical protein
VAFYVEQFRDLITRVLQSRQELYSEAAVNLLLGTAAQETGFGTYLRQSNGPALGVFQMEPQTFDWLQGKYGDYYPKITQASFEQLEWDLWLAIIMARLRYRVVRAPLPEADDLEGMAAYWKQWYNTPAGRGTEKQFITSWKLYLGPRPRVVGPSP